MSRLTRLRQRVGEAVRAHALWRPGHRVAVAVSGGPDSVALLDLLVRSQGMHGGVLSVITVDHRQHPSSAEHTTFVQTLAARYDVPCVTVAADLPPRASEASCRRARHAAFEAADVDRVALAHHRDDQAETVLLAMMRGSGAAGRSAMAWRRGRIVRPLLGVARSDLGAWLDRFGLPSVRDPTNNDRRYLRNELRFSVFPALETARPGALACLARASNHARDDERFIRAALAAHPHAKPGPHGFDRAFLATAPPALTRRALGDALPDLQARHLDAILRAARGGGGRLDLPGGRVVSMTDEHVSVHDAHSAAVVAAEPERY